MAFVNYRPILESIGPLKGVIKLYGLYVSVWISTNSVDIGDLIEILMK